MNIETLKTTYPKLFSRLPEDFDTFRELLVIDENENDGEVDELDEVDAEDYNFIVYLPEALQEAISGDENLITLIKRLDEKEEFQDFFPSEIDLYGIQTELDEAGIAKIILDSVEEMLS